MSDKESAREFAEQAIQKGYQVISFDLPEHGERKCENYPCNVWNGVKDLKAVGDYTIQHWRDISLFANSLGAYFSLLAYTQLPIKRCLFLSPILDMQRLIQNMMKWFQIGEEKLKEEREVATPINETLYWDYYCYVKEHPIENWRFHTSILYGSEDNLTEREVVDDFSKRFKCDLTILQGSEHFFHTEEQMAFLGQWLDKNI